MVLGYDECMKKREAEETRFAAAVEECWVYAESCVGLVADHPDVYREIWVMFLTWLFPTVATGEYSTPASAWAEFNRTVVEPMFHISVPAASEPEVV